MSKLRCRISISADGFVAGPNQSWCRARQVQSGEVKRVAERRESGVVSALGFRAGR